MIKFNCPNCDVKISAKLIDAGSVADCPACGVEMIIPKIESEQSVSETIHEKRQSQQPSGVADASISNDSLSPTAVASSECVLPSTNDFTSDFSLSRLVPLLVCCLLFGWVIGGWLLPERAFVSSHLINQIIPIVMLAVPSLALAIIGIFWFVRPSRFSWKQNVMALLFTMVIGLAALLFFQTIAHNSLELKNRHYGKASIIVLIVKFIGWSYQATNSSNLIERTLGYIFGVGFCEETTKLLPLFWFALRGYNCLEKIDFRRFLIIAFFSGLGFGIGEALYLYSPWGINPTVSGNVLRWFALVPSHAIWTVIDAAFLWLLLPRILNAKTLSEKFGYCGMSVLVVAVVHGLYDVLCGIPFLGILFNGGTILIMYWVINWISKKNEQVALVQNSDSFRSKGILGWLENKKVGNMNFGWVYGVSATMIISSLAFSTSLKEFDSTEQESSSNDYSASGGGYQVNQRDQQAFKRFKSAYEIAKMMQQRGVSGNSLEVLIGAITATDWSDASPQLQNAVNEVTSIHNGETKESALRKLKLFTDIAEQYGL